MRDTLLRVGRTGSTAGEAGTRIGGRHRAELTANLTKGMTPLQASKLFPDVGAKYISAAQNRSLECVSTLGENYATGTRKETHCKMEVDLVTGYFCSISDFKSGSGAHTKSRIDEAETQSLDRVFRELP